MKRNRNIKKQKQLKSINLLAKLFVYLQKCESFPAVGIPAAARVNILVSKEKQYKAASTRLYEPNFTVQMFHINYPLGICNIQPSTGSDKHK